MNPMKKTIVALAIVGIVIASGYFTYTTYVNSDYEDGTPIPQIIIKLTDVSTDEIESARIGPSMGTNAATTITSTLFAVNPDSVYNIEFEITYSIVPPSELPDGAQLVGFSSLSGRKNVVTPERIDKNFFNYATGTDGLYPIVSPTASLINYATTSSFAGVNYRFDKAYNRLSTQPVESIKGIDLGGSVWTLICHAQTSYAGTGAYSGTTTVTINMLMGAENLTVTIGGVDVAVTTP
jgi:hypothetical protein